VPVLTDVHTIEDIEVAESGRCAADPGLPVPPDRLHHACAQSGKPVNIKKGQFLAPHDMKNVIDKARAAAKEAGLPKTTSWPASAAPRSATTTWCPTCARWPSCAKPAPGRVRCHPLGAAAGRQWHFVGRQREMVPVLARAAVAVGVAGLFMETHPNPAEALSDGPNAVPLGKMKDLLSVLIELDRITKKAGFLENSFN
jgi:2-dehydro-3-deoxyphosphooctonate aldolase (KDO 8-P synthase)